MPRGNIDWKSTDSYTRLLAAMVAAQDMKLNYKKIADMYGEGATYDAIEGRFRIIRKEADKLKTEIDRGERAPAPPRGTAQSRSPRKNRRQASVIDLDTVESGRVRKPSSAPNTPSKRRTAAQIKKELLESSATTSTSGDATGTSDGDDAYLPADSSEDMAFDPSLLLFSDPNASMTTVPDMSFIEGGDEYPHFV